MSLDLGALVGRAIIDDGPFQRTYARLMRQMADLGRAGEKTAASTATLDESLAAAASSGTKAAAGIDRTTRASTSAAAAEEKAAAAASRHAQAVARVAAIMTETADMSPKVQSATLRVAAAQERLNELQASGTATTRQLASAQANLITTQRSLAAAQDAGAASTSRWRASLMMALRTAAELGLLIGGIEIARKAIEYVSAGKHLTDALNSVQAASHATDREMKAVRAQAIALGKDLTVPRATAIDAAEAIDDLVRAGMTLPRAMGAARAALLLAAAANVSTADSARVLGDVLDEFKLPASEATKTANILAGAATASAGGLMSVFEAFTYVGTRARALGLGVKDIAAAIIDLSKAGILGDRAGTGLAMMLQRLASESPKGQKALDDLGVTAWNAQGKFVGLPKVIDQLHSAQQRMGTGSQQFVKDVSDAFGARAANVVAAFALRGVEGYNTMYSRLSSGDVEKAAALMNRGAGAGFRQLDKEFTAAGIAAYDKFEKPLTSAIMWVGDKLPAAVSTAAHVLGPFGHFLGQTLGTAWDLFIDGAKLVGVVLGPVVHLIEEIRTPLGAIGVLAIGAYLGFKVFSAVPLIMTNVAIAAKGALLAVGDLAVGAVGAGAAIAESGAVAEVGWAGILGPLGAAFVGVALLVSMFHRSSAASKEASDAAKAYSDAVKSGNEADLTGSIVSQLSKNNVPAKVDELNKSLGNGRYTAKQFASAIQSGGKPLTDLRKNLQSVIDVNEKLAMQRARSLGRGQGPADPILTAARARSSAARTLLSDLNAQSSALTKSQVKEIANYKALGMVAVAVDEVGSKLGIGSDAVKKYAGMLGLAVTKNGDLVNATKANQQAILAVSQAYDTASQSGNDFLTAEDAFSKSGGTAADRAAMIGATLKASNGDALGFAAAMAASTSSVDALTGAFKSQRDQLAQQSADQAKAADAVNKAHRGQETSAARVTAAEARLAQVRSNSKSTAAQIKAAEAAVTAAQNASKNSADALGQAQSAAGKAGALAYADTERAALKFTKTSHGLTASIDTNAKGAGDLVSQLQAIQDSAVKAAGAMFQHQRSVESGTKAADDAYNVYVSKTRGVFIDTKGNLTETARQLGLTRDQAKALADQYLATPSTVKTLIEAEGANPVVTVLNKIGQLLANITGQQWNIPVNVMVHGSIPHPGAKTGRGGQAQGPGFASGTGPGGMPDGWAWVGNELVHKVGSRVDILNATRSKSIASLIGMGGPEGLRIPVASPSMGAAAGTASPREGDRHFHIGNFENHQHFPEQEPGGAMLPYAMDAAANALDGY